MQASFPSVAAKQRFCLVMVKPTHYCDDGYPIQWLRSAIPSNSSHASTALPSILAERKVLGENVEFDIHPLDEANTRIRPEKIARLIQKAGAGMVMLVGVQSNQTPRAARHRAAPAGCRNPGGDRRIPHVRRHLHDRWR